MQQQEMFAVVLHSAVQPTLLLYLKQLIINSKSFLEVVPQAK